MQNRDKEGKQIVLLFQDSPSFSMEICILGTPPVLVLILKVPCVRDRLRTAGHPECLGDGRQGSWEAQAAKERGEHSLSGMEGIRVECAHLGDGHGNSQF